jgi:cytochrome c biogenesis protein CcmG, thiol:disulfide interchange protein DsbE
MLRFLLLMLTVPLFVACEGSPRFNVGTTAPGFSTTYMDGKAVRFPDDFRGKPVVIRFWADWCNVCEGEMKTIEKVYQNRRAQGLQLLAVNTGQDKDTVNAFMRKIGVSYPALLDDGSAIARKYGVVGLPTTFFIGSDGIIKAKVVGEADVAIFDKLAGGLLNESH